MGSIVHKFGRNAVLVAGLMFSLLAVPGFCGEISPDTLAHLKSLRTVLGKTASPTSRAKFISEIDRIRGEYNLDENDRPRVNPRSGARTNTGAATGSSGNSQQTTANNSGSGNTSPPPSQPPPKTKDDPTNPKFWDGLFYRTFEESSLQPGVELWQAYVDALRDTRVVRDGILERLRQQVWLSKLAQDGRSDGLARTRQAVQEIYDHQESEFKSKKWNVTVKARPTAEQVIVMAHYDSDPRLTFIKSIQFSRKRSDGVTLMAALFAQPWDRKSTDFLGSAMEQFSLRFKTDDIVQVLNEIFKSMNTFDIRNATKYKSLDFINGATAILKGSPTAESIRVLNLARRNNPFNKSDNLIDRDEYQRRIDLAVDQMVQKDPSLGEYVVREETLSPMHCFFSRVRAAMVGN
jgi:hypothetical protein